MSFWCSETLQRLFCLGLPTPNYHCRFLEIWNVVPNICYEDIGAHCEQNCMSSHMKTVHRTSITSRTCNHREFHISHLSLKLGNSGKRKVTMPEKIGCLMHIMTGVGQRILSNPVHQRIFRAELSALGTSEGLLASHCLILPRKKHWKSPGAHRHCSWKRAWQSIQDGME